MFNLARGPEQLAPLNGIERARHSGVRMCPGVALTMASVALASAQITSLAPAQLGPPTQPITGKQRVGWAVTGTVGPASLLGGTISAGWGTLFNSPHEYGP